MPNLTRNKSRIVAIAAAIVAAGTLSGCACGPYGMGYCGPYRDHGGYGDHRYDHGGYGDHGRYDHGGHEDHGGYGDHGGDRDHGGPDHGY